MHTTHTTSHSQLKPHKTQNTLPTATTTAFSLPQEHSSRPSGSWLHAHGARTRTRCTHISRSQALSSRITITVTAEHSAATCSWDLLLHAAGSVQAPNNLATAACSTRFQYPTWVSLFKPDPIWIQSDFLTRSDPNIYRIGSSSYNSSCIRINFCPTRFESDFAHP